MPELFGDREAFFNRCLAETTISMTSTGFVETHRIARVAESVHPRGCRSQGYNSRESDLFLCPPGFL